MTIRRRIEGMWQGLRLETRASASQKLGGSPQDEGAGASSFRYTAINYDLLKAAYRESWLIKARVDMPIDDAFSRGREFEGDGADAMREAEKRLKVIDKLKRALKNAVLFGVGMIVVLDDQLLPDQPFDVEALRTGGLLNLLVTHNFDVTITDLINDASSPEYGEPVMYQVNLLEGNLLVHPSRVIRIDAPGAAQERYDGTRAFPDTALVPLIDPAVDDIAVAGVIGHLANEASLKVLKVQGLKEKMARDGMHGTSTADRSINETAKDYSRLANVYRTTLIDTEDEVARTEVGWNGIDNVMSKLEERVAGLIHIPATRLYGISPAGMNATGESDARNYALSIKALQQELIAPILDVLDRIVAQDAGLSAPPDYEFVDLLDFSELDKAKALAMLSTGLSRAISDGVISRDEARRRYDESGLVGDLSGPAPELPEPVEESPAVGDGRADGSG